MIMEMVGNRSFTLTPETAKGTSRCDATAVTEGEKRGHLPQDSAAWVCQIEVGMLLNNYKMSTASGCYTVAISHQDHQCS